MSDIGGFIHDEIPSDEVDRIEATYGPLTVAVRELVDATIRSTVSPEEAALALAPILAGSVTWWHRLASAGALGERSVMRPVGCRYSQLLPS